MDIGSKLADYLRQGADALVNFPTEAQRFLTNPQAFTELVTGKNPLPKETGFVAVATGLPAKNLAQGGVLNPASAPYQEGYEQGEPVAIAGMALPAYATALRAGAPKAYNALENYMVKSGGMIPLEAYHGTPHKIEGAFDINKVGTGEGAQAYGHGMYFAEAPQVAETYKRAGGGLEVKFAKPLEELGINPKVATNSMDFDENPVNQGLGRIAKSLRTTALDYPDVPLDQKLVKEHFDEYIRLLEDKYPKEAAQKTALQELVAKEGYPEINFGGNLYKVDIPDENIPNMLNWDLPISQQSAKVQEIARQLDPNLMADTPHLIVRGQPRHWTEVVDSLEDLQNPKVMKLLKKIYGEASEVMPYGDYLASKMTGEQLYRNLSNPTQWSKEAAPYAMKAGMEDAAVSAKLNELGVKGIRYKDAMSRGADEGTSNFVVFDPSTVKILEENSKPVSRRDLLEQLIDKEK
jgi:hypothetical protein